MPTEKSQPTIGGLLLQHVIVFLICIVFPGLVTWMAPATWLTYERVGETVSCKARTCVFFVVPYRVQVVDQVVEVNQREKASRTEKKKEFGRTTKRKVHVDGEGFLLILGVDEELIEVSVSPASLDHAIAQSKEFLESTAQGTKTMFVIANWKFGALMGGILTSFTLLYVVGYTLGFFNLVFTGFKRGLTPKT